MNLQETNNIHDILNDEINFDFPKYFVRAWEIYIKNIGQYVLFSVIFFSILIVNSLIAYGIPFGDTILNIITGAPLTAGLYISAYYATKNKFNFSNFFDGFNYFVPLLVYSVISSIFIFAGIFALIIPGIYLSVAYTFSIFFIVFNNLDFWEAMELSRKFITKFWWQFFGLILVLGLLNVMGAMFLFIGLLFTLPYTYIVIFSVFEDLVLDKINKTEENTTS